MKSKSFELNKYTRNLHDKRRESGRASFIKNFLTEGLLKNSNPYKGTKGIFKTAKKFVMNENEVGEKMRIRIESIQLKFACECTIKASILP